MSGERGRAASEAREGVVTRSTSGHCLVASKDRTWQCRIRGRLKHGPRGSQTIVVVGDRVSFGAVDEGADPPIGIIEAVLPRRNRISRQSARRSGGHLEQVLMANLDQVLAVQSLAAPAPQAGFVDRLLVAAERFGVPGVLVLNKCDLVAGDAVRRRWMYYGDLGYRLLWTSAVTGAGLPELKEALAGRISILLGASGVGKSTLLNAIEPGLGLRVGDVTEKTGLGRHTTTRTELYRLVSGGFVADSPGIRGFDPWGIAPGALRDYFPDFAALGAGCRYRTCQHADEPDCAVKAAVAAGRIPRWRHDAYLALWRDLQDRQEPRRRYR